VARPPTPPVTFYEEQKRKANENVVTIMGSGRLTGYSQFAEDISNVLEEQPGSNLRIIPLIGKGAGQNVLDMLYLRGIDMGIVDQDILSYFKRKNPAAYGDVDQRIHYIAKVFNTVLHVYAKRDIRRLEDLRGKKVSCLKPLSTVAIFCENLFLAAGIDVQVVHDDGAAAMQKVKSGEIAAAARGAQPPLQGFEGVKPEDNLHFVPIDETTLPKSAFNAVRAAYLPARLKASHYPTMIKDGVDVPSVANSSLLAVYNWPSGSDRFNRVSSFVRAFFANIDKFPTPARHPGWADVNLAADVPGWRRFSVAQELVEQIRRASRGENGGQDEQAKKAFVVFLDQYRQTKGSGAPLSDADTTALWSQFQEWWATRATR
jgi:TRAP-type uncharacterized transport system substrate-binding protein